MTEKRENKAVKEMQVQKKKIGTHVRILTNLTMKNFKSI